MKRWGIVLLGLAVLYFVLSPFLTVYQIRSAAEQRDGGALAEQIDFPSVRQDLKDQLNVALGRSMAEEMEDNPFAVLGGLLGGVIIDKMVDAYVTPAGITQLMLRRRGIGWKVTEIRLPLET